MNATIPIRFIALAALSLFFVLFNFRDQFFGPVLYFNTDERRVVLRFYGAGSRSQ